MNNTQSFTPQAAGVVSEESCPLVTGNNLLSNRNELSGDNSAQQTPSTPKEEWLKAEASGSKNKGPWSSTPRTPGANTATKWCPRGRNNIRKWHKSPKKILCYDKKIYVLSARNACAAVLKQLYNNPLAGHFGFKKTLDLIQRYYPWPGMTKNVGSQAYIWVNVTMENGRYVCVCVCNNCIKNDPAN